MVIAHTLYKQPKRGLYTWTLPDGQYRNQIDYILCNKMEKLYTSDSIKSAKTRPEADCGSDNQLIIEKFRLKLKKVG